MFSRSRTLKMAEKAGNDEGWVGFVCKECGAPLAVHRSTTPSKTPERLDPRLARDLHGVRGHRILRARYADGQNHRVLAINPFHVTTRKFVAHDHDLEDPVLAQELGSSQARGLD